MANPFYTAYTNTRKSKCIISWKSGAGRDISVLVEIFIDSWGSEHFCDREMLPFDCFETIRMNSANKGGTLQVSY
ncbi:unnamed protein product [Onchocerca flexuosa]|uniref:Uncharacterized protein n=1 Tax=Onchocerca flexuosa TaxID=387005 RepID=A0A183HUJ3_9BILA|nr:unnamed protein product [Onchocerca flexuosa]